MVGTLFEGLVAELDALGGLVLLQVHKSAKVAESYCLLQVADYLPVEEAGDERRLPRLLPLIVHRLAVLQQRQHVAVLVQSKTQLSLVQELGASLLRLVGRLNLLLVGELPAGLGLKFQYAFDTLKGYECNGTQQRTFSKSLRKMV